MTTKDQRRAHRRRIRVDIDWDAAAGSSGGWIRDISTTGMFIETEEALPMGTWVILEFVLPGSSGGRVRTGGKVVRHCDPLKARQTGLLPGIGIEFKRLSASARSRLERFVEAL